MGASSQTRGERSTWDALQPRLERWRAACIAAAHRVLRPGTRDWAAACHLAPLLSNALFVGVPLAGPVFAFGLWHWKRGVEPGVANHGREATNFQLNALVWTFLAAWIVPFALFAVNLVVIGMAIAAALRAAQGDDFRYPGIFRPFRA